MRIIKDINVGAVALKSAHKERGITLVALIITIIVMLILVGVSIQVVINSDLIGTAQDASSRTETAYEEEGNTGEITVGDKTYGSIENYMEGKIQLKPGETATDGNATYKGITIPKGFTISKITGEYEEVEQGIVIYDLKGADSSAANFWTETVTIGGKTYPKVQTLYNQFVWVPVKDAYITAKEITDMINSTETDYASVTNNQTAINYLASQGIYPMAVQLDNGEDYRGILYNFAAGTNGVAITSYADFSILEAEDYTLKTYNREPAFLTDNEYADGSSYDTIGLTQEKLQEEYNAMVKSVKDNGGFYVARYELIGNSTDGYGSKRGQIVANAGASSANMWYGLYNACQGMYNKSTDKVQSTMISGAQWDQIMIWMKDVKNTNNSSKYYILDSSYMGWYSDVLDVKISGYLDNYGVKKVFDLGGNLFDFTTEAHYAYNRVNRGINLSGSGSTAPASFRYTIYPYSTSTLYSARSALYVK